MQIEGRESCPIHDERDLRFGAPEAGGTRPDFLQHVGRRPTNDTLHAHLRVSACGIHPNSTWRAQLELWLLRLQRPMRLGRAQFVRTDLAPANSQVSDVTEFRAPTRCHRGSARDHCREPTRSGDVDPQSLALSLRGARFGSRWNCLTERSVSGGTHGNTTQQCVSVSEALLGSSSVHGGRNDAGRV